MEGDVYFPTRTKTLAQASSQDITASLHRNVPSWGVWRGQEEKESASRRAITHSQTTASVSHGGVSNFVRTAGVPDVDERVPKAAYSSITFAAQKVFPAHSTSQNAPKQHGGKSTSIPKGTMRVSNSPQDVCKLRPTVVMANELRQVYSPADGLAAQDGGKGKVQLVHRTLSSSEGERRQDPMADSLTELSSQPPYRSCIHLQVPVRSACSAVFLDKSLFIPLVELKQRGAGQPTLCRSTLSIRLSVSSCRGSSAGNKPAKTNEGYRKPREVLLGHKKHDGSESGLGHCRAPLSKHQGCKVKQIVPAHGVNSKASESGTQHHSDTLGLLSFRGPSSSNTKAGRQKENADEAAFLTRSNSSHRLHTSTYGSEESKTWSKRAEGDETGERRGHKCSTEPENVSAVAEACPRPAADSPEAALKTLSLQNKHNQNSSSISRELSFTLGDIRSLAALELFRPDFISRSQNRVKRLEQRAMRRRALQDSNPDLVQGLQENRCKPRGNCTTPDPLSDNLFKPRERSISGREMQLRSRRIYNKLPEVTKKKEEEKKRAVSQTNRLRAEVFKKRLLDQILQR